MSKKFLALLLALAMVFCMASVALADDITVSEGGDLAAAIAAAKPGDTIQLLEAVTISEAIVVPQGVIFDGNNKTITAAEDFVNNDGTTYGKMIFVAAQDVTIKNVVLDGANKNVYGVHFYETTGGQINNLSVSNTQAPGLQVNSAAVVATGTITFENNGWRTLAPNTIEVAKGEGTANNPSFNCNGATFVGVKSVYGPAGSINMTIPAGWAKATSDGVDLFMPVEDFVAQGFEAAIGTNAYPTLQAAIDAAQPGDTVTLLKDYAMPSNKRVDIDKNITLDLNGFTLTSKDGGSGNWMAIYVNEGTFTLVDSSDAQTGKIVSSCYGVYVKQNATFNLVSGTIHVSGNGTYDQGVVVWNGTFNMTGGKIEAQVGVYTSEYYAKNGDSTLPDSKVSITNGTINVSGDYPDFVVSDGVADITISGGTFTGGNEWTGVWQIIDSDNNGTYDEDAVENKVITGGTFAIDPSDFVASGYVVNGSGPYTVSRYNPIVIVPPITSDPEPTPEPEPEAPVVPDAPAVDTDAPVVDSTTTENADGSSTTTETLENGAVVETTTSTDGSKTETATKTETVETEEATTTTTTTSTTNTDADGNVVKESTEEVKVENADGSATTTTTTVVESDAKTEKTETKEETVVKEDGTTETTTTSTTETTLANGSTGTTTVDEAGNVAAEVTVSAEAVEEAAAAEAPIELAMPEVAPATTTEAAPVVTITTNSEEDVTVAIPVAEDAGAGTVAILVNEDGTETILTDSMLTENGLEATIPDGATIKIVDNSTDFADVDEDAWYEDAIDFASARNIMNGTSETGFAPKDNASRAMVWTMLARLEGIDTTTGENWYDVGQQWAIENGISDGTNGDADVTREQLITMLWRYMGRPESDHDITYFTDHHETSDFALDAKQWAVEMGIISGVGNNVLDPGGDATRGQLAQIFMNLFKL